MESNYLTGIKLVVCEYFDKKKVLKSARALPTQQLYY